MTEAPSPAAFVKALEGPMGGLRQRKYLRHRSVVGQAQSVAREALRAWCTETHGHKRWYYFVDPTLREQFERIAFEAVRAHLEKGKSDPQKLHDTDALDVIPDRKP